MPADFLSHPFTPEETAEDHRRLRQQAQAFTSEHIAPLTAPMEARGPHTDHTVRAALAETGWLGVLLCNGWGGLALGHVAKTVILQVLAFTSPAAAAILQASVLGAAPIAEFGSEEMQRAWLPEIAAGRCWPTIAVTEPGRGSHVLGIETTARRSGRQYILEGEKVLVGNAALGDVHCVVARTGKAGKANSLTAFLVEKGTLGLDIVPAPVNGLHGFSVDTVRLTRVCVPATHVIGHVGDGLAVAQHASVVYGRLNLAAVALGTHQRLLQETAQRVTTRPRYRGNLSDLDTVRHRIADMQHHLMTAELAAYHAAHLLDQGVPCDPWLHHAKLTAHRAGAASCEHAKQLWGGHAARLGSTVEQFRRDFDLIHAPAGPDDLQLIRLAEHILGPHRPHWSAHHTT
ncbi:acyl-CoA dehydrogenase family protein [Streptomyces broussonetiae]|uniref:Acyl-CoA dehydrogenase family protein n=1 Tax=Streptomyces broussonetiae TaxID=2686304 RepID=A0ABV5EMT9_9ACTN